MKVVKLFIICLVMWYLVSWPYDFATGRFDWQMLAAGVIVSFCAAIFFRDIIAVPLTKLFSIRRIFWFLLYIPVFVYYMIVANLDVLWRIVHPMLPINPGIVKVKTRLASESGRTALANSITLTPGTLTVDATEDGFLYVHWISVKETDIEAATAKIVARFEVFLTKIFD